MWVLAGASARESVTCATRTGLAKASSSATRSVTRSRSLCFRLAACRTRGSGRLADLMPPRHEPEDDEDDGLRAARRALPTVSPCGRYLLKKSAHTFTGYSNVNCQQRDKPAMRQSGAFTANGSSKPFYVEVGSFPNKIRVGGDNATFASPVDAAVALAAFRAGQAASSPVATPPPLPRVASGLLDNNRKRKRPATNDGGDSDLFEKADDTLEAHGLARCRNCSAIKKLPNAKEGVAGKCAFCEQARIRGRERGGASRGASSGAAPAAGPSAASPTAPASPQQLLPTPQPEQQPSAPRALQVASTAVPTPTPSAQAAAVRQLRFRCSKPATCLRARDSSVTICPTPVEPPACVQELYVQEGIRPAAPCGFRRQHSRSASGA